MMKKLILTAVLFSLPFYANAAIELQEGFSVNGSVFAVKKAKKYSSIAGCSEVAESKDIVKAFTFDTKTQKCTLYKRVRGLRDSSTSVSGVKS